MRKKQITNEILANMVVRGKFDGLSLTTTTTPIEGTTLTEAKFQQFIDYMKSDEYAQREHERMQWIFKGQTIVMLALNQGIISLEEYYRLLESISINGALIVSPRMYKKLSKVKLVMRDGQEDDERDS